MTMTMTKLDPYEYTGILRYEIFTAHLTSHVLGRVLGNIDIEDAALLKIHEKVLTDTSIWLDKEFTDYILDHIYNHDGYISTERLPVNDFTDYLKGIIKLKNIKPLTNHVVDMDVTFIYPQSYAIM